MTRKPRPPIDDAPPNLRQRLRADGSWRVWWEPKAEARALGFAVVELDANRPTWSIRQAKAINADLARKTPGSTAASRPAGRTIDQLIQNYRRSPSFTDLAPKTQESYARLLAPISAKWGGALVVDFTKPVMNEWYETILRSGKPRMAQALIRQMSILFSRAEIIGWRAEGSNPCFRLKMRTPDRRRRRIGWKELDALVKAADDLGLHAIGTACLLLTLQGQRSTDVRQITRDSIKLAPMTPGAAPVWIWAFRRQKRGNEGAMQLHPEVEARLRPVLLAEAGQPDAPLLTVPDTGRPYSEDLFIKHFNRARDAAAKRRTALAGIQMRDLRRTFGVLARQAGASREDVGDALGNTSGTDPALYDIYMPATLETASRAVASIKRPKEA
ncbi:hypothetical protein [Pararhodobacter sp.]|uniref:hypothetical protein n=1 Tax=Pararhodobacter sp. TaxID=2127056 RepID=UPI002FDE87A4